MVNRLWPLKWVGFSNNQEYKNVRNAAALYAKALNTPNSNAEAKAQKNATAKDNLNIAVKAYLNKNKVRPEPRRFGNRFRRAPVPPSAPPPATPSAPGPVTNNRAPNTGNWPNGTYKPGVVDSKRTSVYKVGTDYYHLFGTNKNGRETWAKVKRDGNSNKYSLNITSRYYVKTRNANGRAVFTPMGNANAAAQLAKNKLVFNRFMMLARTLERNTPNKIAKNYLNGSTNYNNSGGVNFNAVRRITKNTNLNAGTRPEFWAAVNAAKANREPLTKNLNKFKTWYATQEGLATNANRADPYVTIIKGTNRNRKIEVGGGIMKGNNNNNSRKVAGGFWNAVNAEMATRARAAAGAA